MENNTNLGRFAFAIGIGWPICCVAVMKLAPGPVATPELPSVSQRVKLQSPPPTDSTGSTQYLSTGGNEQGIRIFWEQPDPDHVKVIIEVPPENAPES